MSSRSRWIPVVVFAVTGALAAMPERARAQGDLRPPSGPVPAPGPGPAMGPGPGGGPGGGGPAANAAQRADPLLDPLAALRAFTLTDELSLDENTAGRLFPILSKYDDETDRLLGQRADIQRRLSSAGQLRDPHTIDKLVDEAVGNQHAFWELEDKRLGELRKVLSPAQIARLLVVLPALERQITNQLQRAIDGKPPGAGPGAGAKGGGAKAGQRPRANSDWDDDEDDDAPPARQRPQRPR